MLFVLIFWEHY